MEEMTKEQRLTLITSWKAILEDQKYDLQSIQLEVDLAFSRMSVLASKQKLCESRMRLAYAALSGLGVRL